MTSSNMIRRLRGALGNGIVWSALWFMSAFVVFNVLRLIGVAGPSATMMGALRTAGQFGVMGGIAGTAFSTFIGLRYHGQGLGKISWVRFGIGGAIVTGLFVPGFIVVMRLLSGDGPLPLDSLLKNGMVGLLFGGAAAAASMKLAQIATGSLSAGTPDEPALGDRDAQLSLRGKQES